MKTTIYDINKYNDNFYFRDQNTLRIKGRISLLIINMLLFVYYICYY